MTIPRPKAPTADGASLPLSPPPNSDTTDAADAALRTLVVLLARLEARRLTHPERGVVSTTTLVAVLLGSVLMIAAAVVYVAAAGP